MIVTQMESLLDTASCHWNYFVNAWSILGYSSMSFKLPVFELFFLSLSIFVPNPHSYSTSLFKVSHFFMLAARQHWGLSSFHRIISLAAQPLEYSHGSLCIKNNSVLVTPTLWLPASIPRLLVLD
jgi:hypothetical protein